MEQMDINRVGQEVLALRKTVEEMKNMMLEEDLEVSDEGLYWNTGDRQQLEDKMNFINAKLDSLSASISSGSMGDLSNLSADEIVDRIEKFFMDDKNQDDKQ